MPAAFSFASRAAASRAPEAYRFPDIEVLCYKQKHNHSYQYSRVALTRCCMIVCSSSVRLLDSSCLKRSLVLLAQTDITPCCAPQWQQMYRRQQPKICTCASRWPCCLLWTSVPAPTLHQAQCFLCRPPWRGQGASDRLCAGLSYVLSHNMVNSRVSCDVVRITVCWTR